MQNSVIRDSNFLMFIDVTKICIEVASEDDVHKLQAKINNFIILANNNGLSLNLNKNRATT